MAPGERLTAAAAGVAGHLGFYAYFNWMTKLLFLLVLCLTGLCARAQESISLPAIGVVTDMENDSLARAAGFAWILETTPKILSPRNVSDAEFDSLLEVIPTLSVPLYGCNIFIPGDLKVVGPNVNESAVLAYVDTVLERAQRAGLTVITWGSGSSRRVPEGFDRVTATAQFVYMGRKVAEVAERYGITLVLENLNSTECNFITSVPEALAIVRAVDHPNFRLCVDIYHMLVDGQPASDIVGVGPYAAYCELAEKEERTPPGVHGDDFTPYLGALHREGYSGNIMIEAKWGDFEDEAGEAYDVLVRQVGMAYR